MQRIGQLERRDRELLLAGDAKRCTARGDHFERSARAEKLTDHWRRWEDLLEVVEHDQHLLAAHMIEHPCERDLRAGELDAEGVQDLPPENLRRFAFKMATGSGKTWVMAMAIVWSDPLGTSQVTLCCPLVFRQTGTCQRSDEPAFKSSGSRKNRSCARVTRVVPPAHANDTSTRGDPG